MGIGKRPKEEIDNGEQLHVAFKHQRIEKEQFVPPPLPSSSFSSSSSSSSTKTSRSLTSIHKDVGPHGRKRWGLMCKIPGITHEQKENWGRGWCAEQHILSTILDSNPSFDIDEFRRIDFEINKLRQAEKNTVPLPPPPPSSSSSSSSTPTSRRSSFSPSNSPHQSINPFLTSDSSSSFSSTFDSSSSSSYNPFLSSKLTSAVSPSSSLDSSSSGSSGCSLDTFKNIYSNINQ
jgi:hypothetical protein